ncbi:hypothetical protein DFR50_108168 [Roseiarcus fermentans]|uniref:Uncharacterized protein n=1 Tax=Roseiarcus fermentans TaxID=1473586 RepID=A0A366FM08_9HYPH|nr:hypothetical protein [Roseiarcus fermentans]RBP15611.1 hypothetical protein DFR50_108168 [Roseiarcus fermentans]
MKISNVAMAAAAAAFLLSPIEAGALEVVSGGEPAALAGDGMVQTAQYRHAHVHPGYRPGVHPGYRPGVHPGYRPGGPGYHPGYRPGAPGYRPGAGVVAPRAVWVGRPSWYRWAPGGAIAAGAAIGFVAAAAAVAYASAPPQPGLCWYYTDPSRTQGFWDACP